MSLLPETNMINSIQDLNKFAEKVGVKSHSQLLPKLIEHRELVSSDIAILIQSSSAKTVYGINSF